MASLREKLRVFATTWLVFQVAWISALVPRDCCAAHRPPEKTCHKSAPAVQCPMRGADGTPCPMHRQDAQPTRHHAAVTEYQHHQNPPPPPNDCRLSGSCDGPMAALFALLSNHGILPEPSSVLPLVNVHTAVIAVDENLVGHFESPDPPPPRA